MKAKYAVVIFLFVGSLLGGIGWAIYHNSYEAGKSASNKEWETKWANRDRADKSAQLVQKREQRGEGRRRQTENEDIVSNAETEKHTALSEVVAAGQLHATIFS